MSYVSLLFHTVSFRVLFNLNQNCSIKIQHVDDPIFINKYMYMSLAGYRIGAKMIIAREYREKKSKVSSYFENRLSEGNNEPVVRVPMKFLVDTGIERAKQCLEEYTCSYRNMDTGGLFAGAAGLGYMVFCLARSANFESVRGEMMRMAGEIADKTVEHCTTSIENSDVVSFFFGKGGMFAVSAAIYRVIGKEHKATEYMMRYVQGQTLCKDTNYSLTGGDDVSNGRCGYMAGLIWLSQFFTYNELRIYALYPLLQATYQSGKKMAEEPSYGPDLKLSSPLMFPYFNVRYLGALNGLCGELQVFLMCSFFLNENKDVEEDVHKAVDFLLSLQQPDGSFPDKMEDIKEHASPETSYEVCAQWQTGACGMLFLMARAYRRWKSEKYLKSCVLCAEFIWKKGLTRSSIGLTTGTAGNCYAFLIMYRLLNDTAYLHKAIQFALFIFSEKCLRNIFDKGVGKNPYNLSDGLAGAVVLLVDLVNHIKADFPFLPVFTSIEHLNNK